MPDASLIGRATCALAVLLLPLMTGCANKTDVTSLNEFQASYSGVVSAREYGFVRPARDVSIKGRAALSSRANGGDLWNRVRSGMHLDLHANTRIDSTLERFRRDPRYLEKMSQRAKPYLPVIIAEIERRGFPMELALLPHVESRYNPNATSPKAAGGMWQFMPYTAREMGLRLNGDTDERRDVVASTRAAMDYLEQLSRRFDGDWELAMAAYNCGPGRVASAQEANRRNGKPTDFWSLDLPNETEQYVPQILAVSRLVAESRKYGQRLPAIPARPLPPASGASSSSRVAVRLHERQPATEAGDRIHVVRNGESLTSIALRHGLDLKTLADWNGMSARDPLLPGQSLRIPKREASGLISYRVRKGDSLTAIARRHGVSISDIRRWNRIANNRLNPGDRIRIYRRPGSSS